MNEIVIRNIDNRLMMWLRSRAKKNARSPQEEALQILKSALATQNTAPVPGNLARAIRARIEPLGGIELTFPRHRR